MCKRFWMFPNYHRNLIKPKANRISIFINIFVIFFSLNFNSFLFAPTFAEDVLAEETIIESTVPETDIPVEEEILAEENITPDTVVQENITTSEGVVSFPDVENQDLTWEIIEDVLSGSSDFIDEVPVIPDIWPNLDEILTWSLESPLSGNLKEIVQEIIEDQSQTLTWSQNTWNNDVISTLDQNYFDSAFEKDVYNHKVFDLQNILISLWFLTWALNWIYDDATIQSVYQYQLSKNIMTDSDSPSLRWFFGPTTRQYFNDEYVAYKKNLLNWISNVFIWWWITQNIITEKDKYAELLSRVKDYFMQNRYSLENIFGSWVFVWNEDIDFSMLSGQILLPIIFQSTDTLDGNLAEVEFEPWTILKNEDWSLFTWSLTSPEFLDKSVADELIDQNVVSVLDVGWNDEKIVLEDVNWEEIFSKVRIPVPWQNEWNILSINYSHDWETWTYMESQVVFLEDWEPYIEFETNHFTVFSISLPVWTFSINGGAFSTSNTAVTLNSNVSWATHMRFANTGVSLTGAAWVTYATWYSRNLLSTNGTKTVYAQYSWSYGTQTLLDTILLDTTATWSNLKFSLNGSKNGTEVLDISANGYTFSGMWSIWNPTLTGEQVLSFNWNGQYAQRTGVWLTAYPFTISAWVNTSRLNATQAIVSIANSWTTTTYYGIEISSTGYPSIVARNTTSYVGTSQEKLYTWKWYHVVWVFASATSRILYVDGDQRATQTSSTLFSGHINPQIRVWRYANSSTNYFSWYMDDVRVYNKTLTIWEIRNLYNARIKKDMPTQYLNVGSFAVNGDAPNTYTTWVTLTSNVTWMTHMRFANTTWDLISASWVTYATWYSWFLINGGTGNRIVYAQYSGMGGIWDAQDNIFLDSSTADSSLRFLLDGTLNWTNVIDKTANSYNFNWIWSIPSTNLSWENVLSLNWTSQYAERSGFVWITQFPVTFSAWVNADTIAWTDAIVMMWNSGTTTTYYGIQLVAGAPSIVWSYTTARTTTSTMIIQTGKWYHIVWVFSTGNARSLYVNWQYQASATTVASFNATNPRIRVWRYVSSTTNYFDGYIDDVRIYNKVLSTWEIQSLYTQRTSRVAWPTAIVSYDITGTTLGPVVATLTGFSDNGTPIAQNGISIVNNNWSWIYVFTWNWSFTFMFRDADWNIGSTIASVNWITPSAGWALSISWPVSFSFWSTWVAGTIRSLEKFFTWTNDYFDVIDWLWSDPGYYTTLAFSDLQYNSSIISKSNIYVKTSWWISLRAGTANSNVVTAITWLYLGVWSPLTFIKRDAGANWWKTWTYWAHIAIKIDIPAMQQPANYTWTIIYTLY